MFMYFGMYMNYVDIYPWTPRFAFWKQKSPNRDDYY